PPPAGPSRALHPSSRHLRGNTPSAAKNARIGKTVQPRPRRGRETHPDPFGPIQLHPGALGHEIRRFPERRARRSSFAVPESRLPIGMERMMMLRPAHALLIVLLALAAPARAASPAAAEPCRAVEAQGETFTVCTIDLRKQRLRLFWLQDDGKPYGALGTLA